MEPNIFISSVDSVISSIRSFSNSALLSVSTNLSQNLLSLDSFLEILYIDE